MPLIKCVDCGKEISNKAPNCPYCGAPMSIKNFKALIDNSNIPMKRLITSFFSKLENWIDKK